MTPLVGTLLSAGLPVVGSLISNLFGAGNQANANRANMELAKYQYDRNLEMWNKQNEYNTPSNQMSRLREAGLNPNLVYGNGSVANTTNSVPQYDAPKIQAYTNFGDFGFSNAAQGFLNASQLVANVKKTNQETSNLAVDNRLKIQQEQLNELRMIAQNYTNSKSRDEADIWKQILEQRLNLMRAQEGTQYVDQQLKHASADNLNSQTLYRDNIGTELAEAQRDKTLGEIALIPYRRDMISANLKSILEGTRLKGAQISEVYQRIMKLASDKQGKDLENSLIAELKAHGVNIKLKGDLIMQLVNMLSNFMEIF